MIQAHEANVNYFLHTSSTLAYGAHPNNPYPLTETSPLFGNKSFHYSHHKALTENIINNFKKEINNNMKIGIVRPSPILSHGLQSFVADILG